MKTKKNFASLILIGGVTCMMLTQCTKEGPTGPDGTNGTNGLNADAVSAADQTAYNAADGLKGGLEFDEFYIAETGYPQPADTAITNNAEFFRCASCHGTDLLGSNGAYIGAAPTAITPGVSSVNLNTYAQSHNIRQIFDAVKHTGGRLRHNNTYSFKSLNSNMPDYGLLMGDGMIWNIVKYLKEKTVNTDKLYDLVTTGTYPSGTATFANLGKDGSAAAGTTYYLAKCANASCHGSTGSIPSSLETVGAIVREEPFLAYHLIKYGFPGTTMINQSFQLSAGSITDTQLKDLYKTLADTVAYP